MDSISIFGGTGFIGSRFYSMYRDESILIPRSCYTPYSNNVLYLISTTDNYNIFSDLHKDINTNLSKLMDVLGQVKHYNHPVFNFVSSWFVYGKGATLPFQEDGYCNPTGFYSITKRCAEQMVICFCETFHIPYRIFRLANVLGENDKGVSKKKNALQYLIREIVNNRDVHVYNNGDISRDFIYVDDVCRAIHLCMESAPLNQIINIGNGKGYAFSELLKYAVRASCSSSKLFPMEPTEFHKTVQTQHAYLDVTKLRSYGFLPQYPILKTLDILIRHYKIEICPTQS
jgi:nucleoside-diphosphate-sugar epimerase